MSNRLQVYEAAEIVVTFDPTICAHLGVCVRGLPAVFDVSRKRWVRPELGAPEDVAAQLRRCPSGALQYQWRGRREQTPAPGTASPHPPNRIRPTGRELRRP